MLTEKAAQSPISPITLVLLLCRQFSCSIGDDAGGESRSEPNQPNDPHCVDLQATFMLYWG